MAKSTYSPKHRFIPLCEKKVKAFLLYLHYQADCACIADQPRTIGFPGRPHAWNSLLLPVEPYEDKRFDPVRRKNTVFSSSAGGLTSERSDPGLLTSNESP